MSEDVSNTSFEYTSIIKSFKERKKNYDLIRKNYLPNVKINSLTKVHFYSNDLDGSK